MPASDDRECSTAFRALSNDGGGDGSSPEHAITVIEDHRLTGGDGPLFRLEFDLEAAFRQWRYPRRSPGMGGADAGQSRERRGRFRNRNPVGVDGPQVAAVLFPLLADDHPIAFGVQGDDVKAARIVEPESSSLPH